MIRFQGTDGVRRPVKPSTHSSIAGATPQQAFLEHGFLTEQFMELYLYCRSKHLIDTGMAREGDNVVIGWDPRDPEGFYTGAAMDGVLKAGLNIITLGVAPTPLIALYTRYFSAPCGVVITASHNPATYNGIKIFTKRGLKLLPPDDDKLSALVMETDYSALANLKPIGLIDDHHFEAMDLFEQYSLKPENSWIEDPAALSQIHLVIDASNGAMAQAAHIILPKAGFGEVVIVNDDQGGAVNDNCGAAELESGSAITSDDIKATGKYSKNMAIIKLFELGERYSDSIKAGEAQVCAAVFDGDGDRLYRVDYDPFDSVAHVLTGDEISVIQAMAQADKANTSDEKLFYNTIESDISAATAASSLGFNTHMAAVGDKWILTSAIMDCARDSLPAHFGEKLDQLAQGDGLSADTIEALLNDESTELLYDEKVRFSFIGAEESGHTITPGRLQTNDGQNITVFHGNGMKALLNVFAATTSQKFNKPPKERLALTSAPFAGGYKKTMYAYYVCKDDWNRNSSVWHHASDVIKGSIEKNIDEASVKEMVMAAELDMLYFKIMQGGSHTASIFIRNSGTENKTGISLRSPVELGEAMKMIGEHALKVLFSELKDHNSLMARAERLLIETVTATGTIPDGPVGGLDQKTYDQLLKEVIGKQAFITSRGSITDIGQWYIDNVIKT